MKHLGKAWFDNSATVWQKYGIFALLVFASLAAETALGADSAQREQELHERVQPLLLAHCLDCHSGHEPDAGLTLDHFDTPLDFLKGQAVWRKAVQKLQLEEMPPADSSQMPAEDRQFLANWITGTLEEIECGLAPNPGQVTLRRLNAIEYRNTVRDLLLVDYEPASHFPADDVGYGFDNIGDVLTLPPLLMEKYLVAAEEISRRAIMTPPPDLQHQSIVTGEKLQHSRGSPSGSVLVLASEGDATMQDQIPWPGMYQLTITASGDQGGDEPCKLALLVDDELVKTLPVRNTPDEPREFSLPLKLRAGSRKIVLRFTNDFYIAAAGDKPAVDRNLHIHEVRLVGVKLSAEKVDLGKAPASHRAIFIKQPSNDADRPAATRAILSRLASRAFRRPASEADVQRLTDLAQSLQSEGESFEASIQVAVQAILISPKFLFRVEPPPSSQESQSYRDLDDFELATRLSYFLWSSMPDDELLKLAWSRQLHQPETLRVQIKRMIADSKANALVENFAGQWLTLRKLDSIQADPTLFPDWDDRIKQLAKRETLTFFAGIMRDDLSVLTLLNAEFTYVNQDLADYYGIRNVRGSQFRKVSLSGSQRAGLLTHASILAVTSNPTRTSPVKRGKWILDNLLATPPPPAPPGVPELKEKGELTGTLRERMEQHRTDPACAGCHKLMDPLGFALEHFDAVGKLREFDEGTAIDTSGTLPDGTTVNGAEQLRAALLANNQEQFVRCLTEKLLTYALGRGLEYYDRCAVDKIIGKLHEQDSKFSTLLEQIVLSDPFQKKGERE